MTTWTLIRRSLRFHARAHLGALLGAAVGSAVLVGALVVGDSVRESLRQMALARLGKVEFALASNDRLFREQLANDLAAGLLRQDDPGNAAANARTSSTVSARQIAPVLQLPGTAATSDGTARANRVQVLGGEERFWQLANQAPAFKTIPQDSVALNETLAHQLQAKVGETILLRVQKPSQLSRDAPLSQDEDASVALRLNVSAIVSDGQFGRFSLQANQIPPFNAFVPLSLLQSKTDGTNRANLLLVGTESSLPSHLDTGDRPKSQSLLTSAATLSGLTSALRASWQLADAELELRDLADGREVDLRSRRVFLDSPVEQGALNISTNGRGILTYLVNELRVRDRATPYSMVTAMGAPVVSPDMRDDEILINQWLADDLQAKPGDDLEMTYYVVGVMRKLEEKSARFRIRAILPMTGAAADRALMPDFPGLTTAENCRDWDAGFPIKTDKIREKDEKYWDEFRGTPKAFVSLGAGQTMWSNRFGNLTAVRYLLPDPISYAATNPRSLAESPDSQKSPASQREIIGSALLGKLDPASLGLSFQPARALALAASAQSQDFGGLFLGFSFFLIVAALLLMALLFQFGIEQRATEVGTLLALGFTPWQVRRLLLGEGGGLALLGGLIGVAGGVWYARAMLHGLSTIWRSAVGTSALQYHARPATLLIGAVAGVAVAWLTIWLALRKQAQQPARELLAEGGEFQTSNSGHAGRPVRFEMRSRSIKVGTLSSMAALLLIGFAALRSETAAAGLFFGAGALLLIGGLAFCSAFIGALAVAEAAGKMTLSGMGVRNATRRRTRSLATLGLLACGSFLIASIGVFRLDAVKGAEKRSSGTGGFALVGESTLPIVHDLNSAAGRDAYGLDAMDLAGVEFVPFRVREGEDASCLNLNRAQKPRLLGVQPDLLSQRGAFTFTQIAKGWPKENPWLLLQPREGGVVPAIGDAASIQWALGKKVGDLLPYTDERGRPFQIRIVASVANSILQGSLVMSEDQFVERFPNESGYRMFLIDAPSNKVEKARATLSRALQDVGLELTPAAQRLAAFNAVQNTYLSTFQVLGGLGLILGSIGLGVVVLRNVLERRSELALLLAVGFRPRALKWLVVSEHGALLLLGLGVGVASAFVAVLPAVLSPGAEVPFVSLGATLGAVLLSGAVWTWLATALALRGDLLKALRNE